MKRHIFGDCGAKLACSAESDYLRNLIVRHIMNTRALFATVSACALLFCAACDDNDRPDGPEFETVNDDIVDGRIVDDDAMDFLGISTVTNPDGTTFDDDNAVFSIVGEGRPTVFNPATALTVYMRGVRFAAGMPVGINMRLYHLPYIPGMGPNLTFTAAGPLTPQANIAGTGYTDFNKYTVTNLDGAIDNVRCRVEFDCFDGKKTYHVKFEGRLLDD